MTPGRFIRPALLISLLTGAAGAQAAVHRLFEDPHRAPLVHLFSIHGVHFPFLACSSRYFLMSSSASALGSGA